MSTATLHGTLGGVTMSDRAVLVLLTPVLMATAAAVITGGTYSRAFFLDVSDPSAIPWMFVVTALATMLGSWLVLRVQASSQRRRPTQLLQWLLMFNLAMQLVALAAALLAPETGATLLALGLLALVVGGGSVMMIQVWTWMASCVDVRQAKRVFPRLGAAFTAAAVIAGLAIRILLDAGLPGEFLFAIAAGFFVLAAVGVQRTGLHNTPETREPGRGGSDTSSTSVDSNRSGIAAAVAALREVPLLGALALLITLITGASLVLGTQFNSAVSVRFDDSASIASFMSTYNAVAAAAAFVVGITIGPRITRALGLAAAAVAVAVWLGLTGALTLIGFLPVPIDAAFWVVVGGSLGEKVIEGISRPAQDAAFLPVSTQQAAAAKLFTNGILRHVFVVVVSGALLVASLDLSDFVVLAPVLIVLAGLSIVAGLRLGPAYRLALISALARGVPLRFGLDDVARSQVDGAAGELLRSSDDQEVMTGLSLRYDFGLPIRESEMQLLDHHNAEIVIGALRILAPSGADGQPDSRPLDADTARRLLGRNDDQLLCATLRSITPLSHPDLVDELAPAVDAIASRNDVAGTHAQWWRDLAGGTTTIDERCRTIRLLLSGASRDPNDDEVLLGLTMIDALSTSDDVASLLDQLDDPATFAIAVAALGRMPSNDVIAAAEAHVRASGDDVVTLQRMVELASHVGEGPGAEFLWSHAVAAGSPVRDSALAAYAELVAATPDLVSVDTTRARAEAVAAIERLERLGTAAATLERTPHARTWRSAAVALEIDMRRRAAESRVFNFLSLLHGSSDVAMIRSHCRSDDRATQGAALELLETLTDDADLRPFVAHFDTGESAQTNDGADHADPVAPRSRPAAIDWRSTDDDIIRGLGQWASWLDTVDTRNGVPNLNLNNEEHSVRTTTDDVMDRLLLIRGVRLFANVPADLLLPLADAATLADHPAGATIFEQGAAGDELYIIRSGTVDVEAAGGLRITLTTGDAFGEMSILDDGPRSATAMAATDCTCLVIRRGEFLSLLGAAPQIATSVIESLSARVRAANADAGDVRS